MEKLVIIYYEYVDEYSVCLTLPFNYESKEAAKLILAREHARYIKETNEYNAFYRNPDNIKNKLTPPPYAQYSIKFAGHKINLMDLTEGGRYIEPEILTLNEWVEQNTPKDN